MRHVWVFICVCLFRFFIADSALANPYTACTKAERSVITDAIRNAKALSLAAAVAVGDTEDYVRWFGRHEGRSADKVRENLKAIYTTIRSGEVATTCANVNSQDCDFDTYAFVYPDEPFIIYICPNFFRLPEMNGLRPGTRSSDNGTREGTIIHEISHFDIIAGTDDICYSRELCAQMARRDPRSALRNADSYQYFTEDITHFAKSETTDRP